MDNLYNPTTWKCGAEGCTQEIKGVGDPIALNSIGWYYWKGRGVNATPVIRCMAHNPYNWDTIVNVCEDFQALIKFNDRTHGYGSRTVPIV